MTVEVRFLPVITVIDEGAGVGQYERIPDQLFEPIKLLMPIYVVDIVGVNKAAKLFYLATRRCQPRRGAWWFGGRAGKDELPKNAAIRKLNEELGLAVSPDRLEMVAAVFHYINEPGSLATQPALQFAFELTPEELASIKLDPGEYDVQLGVAAYDRERLVAESVHETVIAMYDAMFP
ncbi:MAG: NUDIX hydrolase [Patescibacteria group bacterium]